MNKELLFTIFCCILFLLTSGKPNLCTWNINPEFTAIYIFTDTVGFPKNHRDYMGQFNFLYNDSSRLQLNYIDGPCKQKQWFYHVYYFEPIIEAPVIIPDVAVVQVPEQQRKKKVHGDISYDYSSHSSPDTVYPGSGFTQNFVTANLYTTISNKYPVIFHFGTLQTSVPYLSNNIDVSVQFDRQQYSSDMADRVRKQYQEKYWREESEDTSLYRSVLANFRNEQAYGRWLTNDKQVQELMASNKIIQSYTGIHPAIQNPTAAEESAAISNVRKDSILSQKDSSVLSALDGIKNIRSTIGSPSIVKGLSNPAPSTQKDTLTPTNNQLKKAIKFIKLYESKLIMLRDLSKSRDSLSKRYDSLDKDLKTGRDSLEKVLGSDVKSASKSYGDSSRQQRSMNWMLGIRQLGIGRSFIDYSQLSAKNISLFGINAEYCNHYYFALAAGKTDFRYQDFLTSTAVPKQYLLLGRFGIGEKEGTHVYFTAYSGSKQASYYLNNKPVSTKLSGITLEGNFPVSKNIALTGEVGKSTAPSYTLSGTKPVNILSFSDRNNEAYSVQIKSYFPKTDTRIFAVYNRYGIYFQSFNIYNNNATSSSWQVRLDQYLFKKKLIFTTSIRKSDYSNPFIANNYNCKTLIYSLQSTLRIRKWPTLTLAYLPFSQLSVLQGQLTESRFYTLLGSTNYAYRFKKVFLNSSVVYTQYFNSSSQAGFVYYNAQSWFFNQSVLFGRLTVNGGATISHSVGYHLFSAGPSVQWNFLNSLSAGGGIKYNLLNGVQENFGYNGNIQCLVKKMGKFGISYERGFIPSQNDQFFRNNWGRATYSKFF